MLLKLYVRNYALIKDLDVDFEEGLTIITGETGAGKSILLGALSLILGNRADTNVLLEKDEKCIVEGTFRISDYNLEDFFGNNSLDYGDIALIRREINPAGKSRAFINDTPVTINLLKELGDRLIDIHSQHQTLMLNSNSFQLNVIDSLSSTGELKSEYRLSWTAYRHILKELTEAREMSERQVADLEYYTYQLARLDEAKLAVGEQEELEKEQELLSHAEEIRSSLEKSSALLSADEQSAIPLLREIRTTLGKIESFLPSDGDYLKRIDSAFIDLTDLNNDIERFFGSIESDPGRLNQVNERLDLIYSLIQKHKVQDENALIDLREEMRQRIAAISTSSVRVEELESKLQYERQKLIDLAENISGKRSQKVPALESEITGLLQQLGMPNARFRVSLTRLPEPGPEGIDQADFLFSANKQVAPENLARIASGGELSRVMLSLKSLLTLNNNLPTIIFDEIDAGVSGEVADKVGQILASMGKYMQVINITHLPQVAARGKKHFHVYKDETTDSTITRIRLLTDDERKMEVARLLSGREITETAVRNAEELIKSAEGPSPANR